MDVIFAKLMSTVALPPGTNLALLALGLLAYRWWRKLGMTCIALAVITLYFLSTPKIAASLVAGVETIPALQIETLDQQSVEAIVVLGGGLDLQAPEYGEDVLSSGNLPRLRYTAYLHRRTALPILVTGGRVYGEGVSEAELMRSLLTKEWGVPVQWMEGQSRNTAENAANSAKQLREAGLTRILLVTHASHMKRALASFEAAGLEVTPAPVEFRGARLQYAGHFGWLPNASALSNSSNALYEHVGRLWYWLRY